MKANLMSSTIMVIVGTELKQKIIKRMCFHKEDKGMLKIGKSQIWSLTWFLKSPKICHSKTSKEKSEWSNNLGIKESTPAKFLWQALHKDNQWPL